MTLNPFQNALAVAMDTIHQVAGVLAEYTRDTTTVEVRVVPANELAEIVDDDGAMLKTRRDEFLIFADELESQGIELPPARGDRIVITINEQAATYEVIGPGGRPPWSWSDPAHTRLRVHTQEI